MFADFRPTESIAVRGAIAIEAAVPGAGKTYLVKSWLDRTGQKDTAVICPGMPWLPSWSRRGIELSPFTSWLGASLWRQRTGATTRKLITYRG